MNSGLSLLGRNAGVLKNIGKKWKVPIEQLRHSSSVRMNTMILFVPQQEAWVVERMGKFYKTLSPGFNVLIPGIDRIKYVQSLKELVIEIPSQSAITTDNVVLNLDGVLYLKINDPYLASYGVNDPEFAIVQLAQTTMRSELGKIPLDKVFREREDLNENIVESINKASNAWGITCMRYEIRDIKLPPRVQEAMQMQVEAERQKRATILQSEGTRAADINVAEGKRLARILASEAIKQEEINRANGEASAAVALAEARAKSLELVARALQSEDAKNAAALSVAEQYVEAFNKLAKNNNTLILPSNVADVSGLVAQAMSIYKRISPEMQFEDRPKPAQNVQLNINPEDDEIYEYFSDKEEAEKQIKAKRQQSETL